MIIMIISVINVIIAIVTVAAAGKMLQLSLSTFVIVKESKNDTECK